MLRPSSSYTLTLRIEYPNQPGLLGRVTSLLGEEGADIGAIDIVTTSRTTITRDITFSVIDYDHGRRVIEAVRAAHIDIIHVNDRTFMLHLGGMLEIASKVPLKTRDDLSMAYLPGVARIVQNIIDDPRDAFNLTIKRNSVAVISDGSGVLHFGEAGPLAALPVMESKAILLKEFGDVDGFPLCLDVQDEDAFVAAVQAIAPTFGAIHLEDIKSPRCFSIENRLSELLDIPVFHNDQHGTAIAVLAALINALKVVGKTPQEARVVINGRGAAGSATARLLESHGVGTITICDESSIKESLRGADALIGFGRHNMLEVADIAAMQADPIVFMVAHPEPEIEPESILGVARVIATGRSDFPNQINNMLCFPGFFRGLLDARASRVNEEMKLAAAHAIAAVVDRNEVHEDYIIPGIFDRRVTQAVAAAVVEAAQRTGMARRATKAPGR